MLTRRLSVGQTKLTLTVMCVPPRVDYSFYDILYFNVPNFDMPKGAHGFVWGENPVVRGVGDLNRGGVHNRLLLLFKHGTRESLERTKFANVFEVVNGRQ